MCACLFHSFILSFYPTYHSLSLYLFVQNEREVTREAGERLARDLNAVFLETCAKDNLCVNDLFQVRYRFSTNVVDPDPVGSQTIGRIRIGIRVLAASDPT
jgi:hypothetical protein